MVALDAAQERNFRAALTVANSDAERERLAFAIHTESAGYIYANDGRNTSKSPGVTPAVAAILRRSLGMPHDKVGSNGRSTGMLQQLSSDVGGGWGDMAGTMDPAESAWRFLAILNVTDNAQYTGTLVTPTGSERVAVQLSDPIAADVLRVQQPLASEAKSSNYGATAVATAKAIAALFKPEQVDWFSQLANNWDEAKNELRDMLAGIEGRVADAVLEKLTVKSLVNGAQLSLPEAVAYINQATDQLATDRTITSRVNGAVMSVNEMRAYDNEALNQLVAAVKALGDAK